MAHRSRPHVAIPPGAAPPSNPSPSAHQPPLSPINLWADRPYTPYTPVTPNTTAQPRIGHDLFVRPPSRASSAYETEAGTRISFPEPQLYRSSSQRSSYRPSHAPHSHRSVKSEVFLSPVVDGLSLSGGSSRPPSFIESTPELSLRELGSELESELSEQTYDTEEGLRKFQEGLLPELDEEWHRLVPPEARHVLEKKEVQRQSIIFEIIKSEKDYVADLELVREVFIAPLGPTGAVSNSRVRGFVQEVFFNLDQILAHHQRMLGELFARQRDQHPLIQSVADIILDTALLFRNDYEAYIKHYPISESRHRSEMRRSHKYQIFINQCSMSPGVRRRDLVTFLSRPVTRLPRLVMLLENVKKYTEPDHPDMETIPLLLGILHDFLKSTQPGIEVSESKVRFWNLCESLVYQKGEIIDMDLYDESRTLMYQSSLARRYKSEVNLHWADLHVALLDNYLLLMKPETRSSSITRHHVISRPIPLEYLRLAAFDGPPENRKEKTEEGGFFSRSQYRQLYPFTIYHASAKSTRRYTLYAASEEARAKWHRALEESIGLRNLRQEANMMFAQQLISDDFFKYPAAVPDLRGGNHYTGKIASATKFSSGTHSLLAVACPAGVFISSRGESSFRKILTVSNPTCVLALPEGNKFFVQHDGGLFAYSLDLVGRVGIGLATADSMLASRERIADSSVQFFRAGKVGSRLMVVYTIKSLLQVYVYALEIVRPSEAANPRRSVNGLVSFRPFGDSLSVSKDSHNIVALNRRIVICSDKGLTLADPTNLSLMPTITSLPDFNGAEGNAPMTTLKSRCAQSRPLGVVRCGKDKDEKDSEEEILVIYDKLGCYTNRNGVPTRNSGYLRWETEAVSYAHRGAHILLLSPEFVEVRTVHTGKLVQVIEGADLRRVDAGLLGPEPDQFVLLAAQGSGGQGSVCDVLLDLVATAELHTPRPAEIPGAWDDFDLM